MSWDPEAQSLGNLRLAGIESKESYVVVDAAAMRGTGAV